MNYKPDDNTLIAYLYGELGDKEQENLDQYFQENPEERKRVQAMAQVRAILGRVVDKEVIAPPVFLDDQSRRLPLWQSTSLRWISGLAASFLVLMVSAKLMGLEIGYSGEELRIGFGKKQEVPVPPFDPGTKLTSEEVQAMINLSLVRNNEFIAGHWDDNQKKMEKSVRNLLDANSKRLEDRMNKTSFASQEQVRTFVDGLQNENLRSIKDYLQLSASEQKKYVESLMVDFSKYLQEQRNQDLNLFQTRLSSMEQNTDQFKQETEQILSSIISNSNGKKQNNY